MIVPVARPTPNPPQPQPQPQRASAEVGNAATPSVVAASKAVSVFLMIPPVFDSVRIPDHGIGSLKALRMTGVAFEGMVRPLSCRACGFYFDPHQCFGHWRGEGENSGSAFVHGWEGGAIWRLFSSSGVRRA